MIPKIIHYCWFGRNPKSGMINECIQSWKNYLPDYKIIEWNEDNFNVNENLYVKQAYENQKWAFVSDYVRLWVLYNYGGIYFDTDVQCHKSMNSFLNDHAFTGYESKDHLMSAVIGSERKNETIKYLLEYYDNKSFINDNGEMDMTTNTVIITKMLGSCGFVANGKKMTVKSLTIYPQIYFCPNNFSRIFGIPSKKSYTIHHFDQSWKNEKTNQTTFAARIRRYIVGKMRNILGTNRSIIVYKKIKNILK